MRRFEIICLTLGVICFFTPAIADQTDPRLGGLFAQLGEVSGPIDAAPIESQIWTIWHETSDHAAQSLLQRGIDAMRTGDNNSALKTFDQLVEIAPDFAEGWNKRATVQFLLGNFDQSIKDIANTLNLEPRHFGALSGLGLVYMSLNDLERALISFEAALAVSPHLVSSRINAEAIRQILQGREI
ncbi:hypothetical protein A9Q96_13925 [Rhodobacterales bacterium 52_120_T64]|nr:hypothetical protein A9Q96_13925 [Rhodobacterales bacterium 52_120_T64]